MKKSLHGFTLVELLVVITIIGILAGIALPVFQKAQEKSRAVSDASNLRQIGLAIQTYKGDNNGDLPAGKTGSDTTMTWPQQLYSYAQAWKVFKSPFDSRAFVDGASTSTTAVVSYGINGQSGSTGLLGLDSSKINYPSNLIMLAPKLDSGSTIAYSGTSATDLLVKPTDSGGSSTMLRGTHSSRSRINVVFADGHNEDITFVKFVDYQSTASGNGGKMRWIYDDTGS